MHFTTPLSNVSHNENHNKRMSLQLCIIVANNILSTFGSYILLLSDYSFLYEYSLALLLE